MSFSRWSRSQAESADASSVSFDGRVPDLEEVELLLNHLHRRLHGLKPEPEEHHQGLDIQIITFSVIS